MKKIIVALMVVAILIPVAYLLFGKEKGSNPNAQNPDGSAQNPTSTISQPLQKTTDIIVDAGGFNPKEITLSAGTRIVWTNKSGGPVTVNSDVYPTNLLYPFLNLGEFDNNSSVSVVFEKSGKYTYHNHLNPNQTGTVTVK